MLTVPYATWQEILEFPTFLDLLDLRSNDALEADQRAILTKVLLAASTFCDNYVEMGAGGTLSAHSKTESLRIRPDRYGRFYFHPSHTPFISLQSLSYGRTIGSMTTYTNLASFVEDDRTVVIDLQAGTSSWTGSLQFGTPAPGAQMFSTWTYLAGYPNTLLTGAVTAGATSIPIADAIGIVPGQSMKVFDPGSDEPVTVSSTWVPTTGPATLQLASPLLYAHPNYYPVRVSAMGHDIFQATVYYAIAMLMRPDSQAEDAFPDLRSGASTRLTDSRRDGSGLIFECEHLLEPYRRTY